MHMKKGIYASFFILALLLLQFSQHTSALTFEDIILKFRDERLIENTNINNENQVIVSSNPNSTPFTVTTLRGTFYSTISLQEKKTYFYFGNWRIEDDEDTNNRENPPYYHVNMRIPQEINAIVPIITQCTLFLKQGHSFLSRTITLNTSTFDLKPTLPDGISLFDSIHLYQCEFDSPLPEQRSVLQTVLLRYNSGRHGATFATNYWTKKEIDEGEALPEEEKTTFCKNIEFTYDKYDKYKKDDKYNDKEFIKGRHFLKITDLAHDYKDGDSMYIRLTGVEYRFIRRKEWNPELSCIIKQILPGDEMVETILTRQIYLAEFNQLTFSNPEFIIKTGRRRDGDHIEYYAGSTLIIQCPEIILYKSIIVDGPNFHISSIIRAEKGFFDDIPRDRPSIGCTNYPCSTFIHHPERQEDDIYDPRFVDYVIGGILVVAILGGIIFACVRSKKREEEEYSSLLN